MKSTAWLKFEVLQSVEFSCVRRHSGADEVRVYMVDTEKERAKDCLEQRDLIDLLLL